MKRNQKPLFEKFRQNAERSVNRLKRFWNTRYWIGKNRELPETEDFDVKLRPISAGPSLRKYRKQRKNKKKIAQRSKRINWLRGC